MKVERNNAVPVDTFWMESAGVGSVAIAQASTSQNKEVDQSRKALQKEERSAEEIKKDLDAVNTQLKIMNRSIQFSIDEGSHDIVVRVVDKESGEVIREVPPESLTKLRERMADITGLLVEEKV